MSNYPQNIPGSSGQQPSGMMPTSTWMNPYYPSSMTTPFGTTTDTMQPWTGGIGVGSQMMQPWQQNFPFDFSQINQEASRMMRSFETQWYQMQREMERHARQMDRRMERAFSSELTHQQSRPASMLEHYSLMNPIRIDGEGNRWLNVYFDMRSYKPEEVNVTLDTKNRCIQVEANHEVKESKEHYIKRHYSRKVYLPEDLKIDLSKVDLKSCLTNEGLLCVEAALPKLSIEEARTAAGSKTISTTTGQTGVYPINVKTV